MPKIINSFTINVILPYFCRKTSKNLYILIWRNFYSRFTTIVIVDAMAKLETQNKKRNIFPHLLVYAAIILVAFQALMLFSQAKSTSSTGGFALSDLNPFTHWGVNAPSSNEGKFSHLTLNTVGYNQMVEWDRTIQETTDLQKQVAGFDALIPCCGFKLTGADPNQDCQCGHHLAIRGLIKYGLTHGWTRDQIQQEINQWKPVFYPVCAQNPKLCDL